MASTSSTKYMNEKCPHGHQLKLMKDVPASFTCYGCKEKGFGPRYCCSCEITSCCKFNLHEECYQPCMTIQHPNFPGDTFDFLPNPKLSPTITSHPRFCDACGKEVNGYVYHCKDGEVDFHPCCNNLPPSIKFTDGSELFLPEAQIAAAPRDHALQLVGSNKAKVCFRCKDKILSGPGTNKNVPGWSYVSTCGDYRFHVYCLMERLREFLRSRETAARLATAPISRGRNGNIRSSTHTHEESAWWEPLPFASTMTGFILGDPTAIVTTAFFEMFNG